MKSRAEAYPAVYNPWLGFTARVAADANLAMGQPAKGKVQGRRAVDLWIDIALTRANFESVQVAKAFRVLMQCEIALMQSEDAFAVLTQAFGLLRATLLTNPRPIIPILLEMIGLAETIDLAQPKRVIPADLWAIVYAKPSEGDAAPPMPSR